MEEAAAAGGGDDILQAETENYGEGKSLIEKPVRKGDGKCGNIEDFDPETKLYKVRFEADHVDELKWEELKNYLDQEISFRRYPQKKKVDKPANDEGKTEERPPQDSSDDKVVTDPHIYGSRKDIHDKFGAAEDQEKDITTAGAETEEAENTLITDPHIYGSRKDMHDKFEAAEDQEKDITTAGAETEETENTLITDTHDNVKVGIADTVSEVETENKVEEDVHVPVGTAVSGADGEGEAIVVTDAEIKTDNVEVDIHAKVVKANVEAEEADEERAVNEVDKVKDTVANEEKEEVDEDEDAVNEDEDAVNEDEDEEVKDAVNEEEETVNQIEEVTDAVDEEEETVNEDEEVKDAVNEDQDSDSLTESDLERLTRKKKHKKRKHVLTLQRWRGYKKRRKLAKEAREAEAKTQENIPEDGEDIRRSLVDEMEVIPRQKSRTRKLTEVEEIQKKRQKITQELRNKLKSTAIVIKTKKAVKVDEVGQKEEVNSSQTEVNAEKEVDSSEVNADDKEEEVKEGQEGQTEGVNDCQLALTPLVLKKVTYSSSREVKPSPFDRGIKLRGRKLRKHFNGKIYRGEIADYDRRTRRYKIRYEDGDEENLLWKYVGPMLVPFEELHTWDDPDSEPPLKVLITEVEKPSKSKEKKPKLPKLKPVAIKRRR